MKYLITSLLLIYCVGCAAPPLPQRRGAAQQKYYATHKEKIKDALKVVYKTIVKHPPLDQEEGN